MICPNCGNVIADDSVICPVCRAQLPARASSQYAQNDYRQDYQQNYQQGYQQGYQQNYQQGYQQNYQQGYQQGYQQPGMGAFSPNTAALNRAYSDAKTAFVLGILGIVLAGGIGIILAIVCLVKSGGQVMIDPMSLNMQERAMLDEINKKKKTARILGFVGIGCFILAIIMGVLLGIFTANSIVEYSGYYA